MPKIQDTPEIASDAAELLEAVGYFDIEDLVQADVSELHAELLKANEKLAILSHSPTEEEVGNWRQPFLTDDITPEEIVEEEADRSNFEDDPEIIDLLGSAPEAEWLPGSLIKENELAVKDISEGILLTDCESDLEINVLATAQDSKSQRRTSDAERTGLETSRIRNFNQLDKNEHNVKPLERGAPREVVSLSEGLNEGVAPEARRFIRGVLHPDPVRVRLSSFATVFVTLALLAAGIGLSLLFVYDFQSRNSMLSYLGGITITVVIGVLFYLCFGLSARCRVCGQRQFVPKKCLKHKKAHHIPVIGYILPTALQVLFFKWFYCIYCGTAVRLKK